MITNGHQESAQLPVLRALSLDSNDASMERRYYVQMA